ncbi:MAG: GAF domain-containing protein [Candidatus Tectomicrobia bacterium]|uniref:GAF domain-containing protein n=1 Tax=Tectimicrobiota bacterium TaxID=2528274 RepID=A0A932I4S7_UNCTE|nr:GAF domain-containing protein [Candidatus Tectomicrobia bacterium]
MPDTHILEEIVELGTRLVGARYGALAVLNERGGAVQTFVTAGMEAETRAAIGAPPRGLGILGALIREPRPLRLKDLGLDPRSAGFPPGHPPMRSFLGVPLLSEGKACGNFYFTEKEGAEEFSPADERMAENFARLAVRAIQHPAAHAGIRRDLETFRSAAADPGAVIIVNPGREIIVWNEGARDLYGYTREEALGRRLEELLIPPERREAWLNRYLNEHVRDLRAGKTVQYNGTPLHKNGREIHVSVTFSPIRHGEAGIMAVTGTLKVTKKDGNEAA